MAKFETLYDDFNDNSFDTSKWGSPNLTHQATETNQRLELVLPATATNCGFESVNAWDLTNSAVQFELYNFTATTTYFNFLLYNPSVNNVIEFYINSGTVVIDAYNNSSYIFTSSFAYNATTHRWLRLRETSGTLYWETSPDGKTWTVRGSVANSINLTSTSSQIFVANLTGVASTTYIDNFNSPTPDDALLGLTADNVTLVQQHNLVAADALLGLVADNVTLSGIPITSTAILFGGWGMAIFGQSYFALAPTIGEILLAPADALLGLTADNVTLVQQHNLVAADALLGLVATGNLALIENKTLAVGNNLLTLIVDNVTIVVIGNRPQIHAPNYEIPRSIPSLVVLVETPRVLSPNPPRVGVTTDSNDLI